LCWCALRATTPAGWLSTGFVFGLCCLCRPTFWAPGIIFAIGWLIAQWKTSLAETSEINQPPSTRWRRAALVASGTVLAVAPWVARNSVAMGRPIVTTTHGGYTLLLGHNPFYTRAVVDQPWGTVWDIERDSGWFQWLITEMRGQSPPINVGLEKSPALEIARDRWMTRRAWQYVREEPWNAVRSSATLLGRFWNVLPLVTSNRSTSTTIRWGIAGFYVLEFVAMLVGLVRLRRDEWPRWWILAALILGFTAVHALYWSDMRMRAPLVPAIALLAARAFRPRLTVPGASGSTDK
jgi:hypothetical protein